LLTLNKDWENAPPDSLKSLEMTPHALGKTMRSCWRARRPPLSWVGAPSIDQATASDSCHVFWLHPFQV
jgi:hypothetical protein